MLLHNKPIIAHFCPRYLGISETFIYRYLSTFQKVRPIVIAGWLENVHLFPLNAKLYNCSCKELTLCRIVNGISKRIIGDYDFYRKLIVKLNKVKLLHAHFGQTAVSPTVRRDSASSIPVVILAPYHIVDKLLITS